PPEEAAERCEGDQEHANHHHQVIALKTYPDGGKFVRREGIEGSHGSADQHPESAGNSYAQVDGFCLVVGNTEEVKSWGIVTVVVRFDSGQLGGLCGGYLDTLMGPAEQLHETSDGGQDKSDLETATGDHEMPLA